MDLKWKSRGSILNHGARTHGREGDSRYTRVTEAAGAGAKTQYMQDRTIYAEHTGWLIW
jgi:hypothetical protein